MFAVDGLIRMKIIADSRSFTSISSHQGCPINFTFGEKTSVKKDKNGMGFDHLMAIIAGYCMRDTVKIT
jgi:hypothetical protein